MNKTGSDFYLQSISTKMGWVVATWGKTGLATLELPCTTLEEALEKTESQMYGLKKYLKSTSFFTSSCDLKISTSLDSLEKALIAYFNGKKIITTTLPIDFSFYPLFTRQILQLVQQIPYGKACSYQQIACLAKQPKAQPALLAGR